MRIYNIFTKIKPGLKFFILLQCFQFLTALSNPASAHSSEVSKKLNKLSQQLSEDYKNKRPGKAKASLAVFNFTTDEKLAKQGVGFALSELLTQKFVKAPSFTLVERNELQKIFDEQKLQITVVTNETAVKVGKLVGAELLLLGSVQKLNRNYQVNARIVEVESGEVLAAGYEELPSKHFEEEAKPYLTLVPKVQVIGLYGSFGYGVQTSELQPALSFADSTGNNAYSLTVTPQGLKATNYPIGVGARYTPLKWLVLDLAYMPKGTFSIRGNVANLSASTNFRSPTITIGDAITQGTALDIDLKSTDIKGSVSWIKNISENFNGYLGLGAAAHFVEVKAPSFTMFTYYNGAAGSVRYSGDDINASETLLVPFARGGLEWKPQSRIGLACFGNLAIKKDELIVRQHIVGLEGVQAPATSPTLVTDTRNPIFKLAAPQFSVELTLSFYF